MPLEAVMICIDNSDYTRNGDYIPTRYAAQSDAVNIVCNAKTNQNMESSVGMLTTAGDRIEVVITPSTDLGKMISELQKVQIKGLSDIVRGIQTAQLALKHRQNKNQKQRIVAFVGSPIVATEKEMETLGKNLKKNNVSLDLVSFGEVEGNAAKLEKLLNAVNSNDSSHILEIPVGPKMLSDVLLSSAIISADGEIPTGAMGGDGGFEFGINPDEDPELALALRISMEEDRQRQQQAEGGGATGAAAPEAGGATAPSGAPAAAGGDAPLPMATDDAGLEAMMGMEDMDDELRQALLLSMQESGPPPAAEASAAPPAEATPAAAPAVAAAPASAPATAEADAADAAGAAALFQDPSFVQELLGQLPGVDISDPRIQQALQEVGESKDKDGDKTDKGGSDDKK